MKPLFQASTRAELLILLLLYALFYGLVMINYIDLVVNGSAIPGYHLWLVLLVFMPFILVLLLYGPRNWELTIGLGLLASLCNDLFWQPMSYVFFGKAVDLLRWYAWQLGFSDSFTWTFNAGFFKFEVTSLLMGLSIYVRILFVALLVYRWWTTD
jgi:hypothetical protein